MRLRTSTRSTPTPRPAVSSSSGHDVLVAASPYPEQPDAYTVEFPTALWYDYWTGEPVKGLPPAPPLVSNMPAIPVVPLVAAVHPVLDTLPVYVRGGAILPIAPLTQSTSENPNGPLTLRVFEGPDCRGSLYLDDGLTYAYQHGHFLRMSFTCEATPDGLRVTLSPHQGDFGAWWKTVRLEVHRRLPLTGSATANGASGKVAAHVEGNAVIAEFPDSGKGESIVIR